MLAVVGPGLPDAGRQPLYLRRPDATEPSRRKSVLPLRRPRSAGSTINILPARRADLDAIMALERAGFAPSPSSGASAAGWASCWRTIARC